MKLSEIWSDRSSVWRLEQNREPDTLVWNIQTCGSASSLLWSGLRLCDGGDYITDGWTHGARRRPADRCQLGAMWRGLAGPHRKWVRTERWDCWFRTNSVLLTNRISSVIQRNSTAWNISQFIRAGDMLSDRVGTCALPSTRSSVRFIHFHFSVF